MSGYVPFGFSGFPDQSPPDSQPDPWSAVIQHVLRNGLPGGLPPQALAPELQQGTPGPSSGGQFMSSATPLQNEISPGGMSTSRAVQADPGARYVPPNGGWTPEMREALNNPMLGFDTGGIGVAGMLKGYHGSPHAFDRFSNEAIGTGEGAQAYGHGHYLADAEEVAKSYRDALQGQGSPSYQAAEKEFNDAHYNFDGSQAARDRIAAAETALENARQATPGHMYEVAVNADPEHFLDWEKPLSEQSQHVQKAFGENGPLSEVGRYFAQNPRLATNGAAIEDTLKMMGHTPHTAAQALNDAGIPGIRYLDAGSRGKGEGSRNTVVFDPTSMEVIRRYGLAGLMAGGGAAAGMRGQDNGQ